MPRQPDADPAALAALLQRIFRDGGFRFERTESGVSTPVYRVWHGCDVFYLRLAESAEDSLAPEVFVHGRLRELGVGAPLVVYFARFDERLQRSALLTTAIPGAPLVALVVDADVRAILRGAGRDLAIINSLPVSGFGWVLRDCPEPTSLRAEHATQRAFACEYLEADLTRLGTGALSMAEAELIHRIVERLDWAFDREQAYLAHGDFDVTHIFQADGQYTGVIDFGEIRGADPLYDLAHFKLHDSEMFSRPLLSDLIAGYREVSQLPEGFEERLALLSLLIGIRAASHGFGRPYAAFLVRRVRVLIAELR